MWGKLTDDEKKPFLEMAKNDAKRYASQLDELKSKGFFIMADGRKSCDVLVPIKHKPVYRERGTQTVKDKTVLVKRNRSASPNTQPMQKRVAFEEVNKTHTQSTQKAKSPAKPQAQSQPIKPQQTKSKSPASAKGTESKSTKMQPVKVMKKTNVSPSKK